MFRAHDHKLERDAAIKFVRAFEEMPRQSLSLSNEARVTAKLNHDNIVNIFDLGSWDGTPFIVMELIEGHTLEQLKGTPELSARRAVAVLIDIAKGLHHAHSNGIVHRDLKPSNVFIRSDGRAKILDFGVALIGGPAPNVDSALRAGTPAYMAPEQWLNLTQDARVDIWAAGVILFELLCGHHPFPESTSLALMRRVVSTEQAPALKVHELGLPDEAARIVQKAMSKGREHRFQTALELREALVELDRLLSEKDDLRIVRPFQPRPERRQVTIVSCVLPGLDELIDDLDTRHFAEAITLFSELANRVLCELKATIVTSTAGKIEGCFGFPKADEDDAERACRAGLRIAAEARRIYHLFDVDHPKRLSVQVGIHTATVVIDARSASNKDTPVIHGNATPIAGWIAIQAAPNTVLISASTERLLRGSFSTLPAGALKTPEPANVVEVFHLLSENRRSMRFDARPATALAQLIGRASESRILVESWQRVIAGSGDFLLVIGDAGIGKSRLMQVLKDHVTASGEGRLLLCQCWPHLRTYPSRPEARQAITPQAICNIAA